MCCDARSPCSAAGEVAILFNVGAADRQLRRFNATDGKKWRSAMAMTADKMAAWCRGILGDDAETPKLPLEKYLEAIPRLESLEVCPRERRLGSRRCRRQARAEARRRRHSSAFDERDARIRPEAGLEADHFRPYRPGTGEIAVEGSRPAGRNPRLRSDLHRGLVRPGGRGD